MATLSEQRRRSTRPTLASRNEAPSLAMKISRVFVKTVFPRLHYLVIIHPDQLRGLTTMCYVLCVEK